MSREQVHGGNGMKLIMIRHAAAVERDAGIAEQYRYLTPEGRRFFRKTARTMRNSGVMPGMILTSPLLRAVQTADILAEALKFNGLLVATDALEPGFDRGALQLLLEMYRDVAELVLVGHEPDFGSVAGALLGLPHGVPFKKGRALQLEIKGDKPGNDAVFNWLASGNNLITSRKEAFG